MNVLLVDDHTLFRESLGRLLESDPEWTITAKCGSTEAALAAIEGGVLCDLALIDYELDQVGSRRTGLWLAQQLRLLRPELPILMVTAGMEQSEFLDAVQKVKVGVFLKSEPSEELLVAMRRTSRGELWVSSAVALSLIGTPPEVPEFAMTFTTRERAVLRLILRGSSNKQIASEMGISESATKAVLQKLFEKAGVRSRSQLVRFAMEHDPEMGDA